MPLHLKYRPKSFDKILGNKDSVVAIRKLLEDSDSRPHAFLLTGPTGCGKTTTARIIAKELECDGLDYREVDSADFRGIDTIRDIRKRAQLKALQGPTRVWVLDECHKLTNDAQNALLKLLEDTPPHVYMILCTTEPQKLLSTLKGRCAQFQFSPLSEEQMFKLLRRIVKKEKEELSREIYEQIVQDSLCYPRNALQILEKVLAVPKKRRLKTAQKAAEAQSQSIELCRALLKNKGWGSIRKILSGLKDQEPEGIRRHVMAYCSSVLLNSDNMQAGIILEEFIDPFYDSGWPGLVLACYRSVHK